MTKNKETRSALIYENPQREDDKCWVPGRLSYTSHSCPARARDQPPTHLIFFVHILSADWNAPSGAPHTAGSTSQSAPTPRDEHQLRRPQFPPASSPTPRAKPGSHTALRRRVSAGRSRPRRFSDRPRVWWPGQSRGAGRCSTGRASTGHGRSPHAQTREERGKGNVPVSSHTPSEAHSLRSLPSPPCLSWTASCRTPGALRTHRQQVRRAFCVHAGKAGSGHCAPDVLPLPPPFKREEIGAQSSEHNEA